MKNNNNMMELMESLATIKTATKDLWSLDFREEYFCMNIYDNYTIIIVEYNKDKVVVSINEHEDTTTKIEFTPTMEKIVYLIDMINNVFEEEDFEEEC